MLTLASLPTSVAGSSVGFFLANLVSGNSVSIAINASFVFTAVLLGIAIVLTRNTKRNTSRNKGAQYALAPVRVPVLHDLQPRRGRNLR